MNILEGAEVISTKKNGLKIPSGRRYGAILWLVINAVIKSIALKRIYLLPEDQ